MITKKNYNYMKKITMNYCYNYYCVGVDELNSKVVVLYLLPSDQAT